MTHEQKPESKDYNPEIMGIAVRIREIIEYGDDRGDVSDFEKLVDAGLMMEGICDGELLQDSLEVGETIWIFTPEGLNAIRLFEQGARP